MIYNDQQKNNTSTKLSELRKAYALTNAEIENPLKEVHLASISGMIKDLEAEVYEYDSLKSGSYSYSKHTELSDLPRALISARISSGLSQSGLAHRVGLKPQQIQRYEASSYMSASLTRLIEIASNLNVKVSESWGEKGSEKRNTIYSWNTITDIDWQKFPFQEMLKRGWLKLNDKTNPAAAIQQYFIEAAGPQYATAYHRKKFYGENTPNEFSLLAWQARILEKANEEFNNGEIREFLLDESWLPKLIQISTLENAPLMVKHYLASKGIILVFERHMPKTYLDGAAMLSSSGNPVIGMTLRHDRLDNFWFVLLHELGHVFLHLFENLGLDFFDEDDCNNDDPMEQEADDFALETLIPPELWEQCLSRFSQTEESVRLDALNLDIHESIIAGRIRKESSNYSILNNLVGNGKLRPLFLE